MGFRESHMCEQPVETPAALQPGGLMRPLGSVNQSSCLWLIISTSLWNLKQWYFTSDWWSWQKMAPLNSFTTTEALAEIHEKIHFRSEQQKLHLFLGINSSARDSCTFVNVRATHPTRNLSPKEVAVNIRRIWGDAAGYLLHWFVPQVPFDSAPL